MVGVQERLVLTLGLRFLAQSGRPRILEDGGYEVHDEFVEDEAEVEDAANGSEGQHAREGIPVNEVLRMEGA